MGLEGLEPTCSLTVFNNDCFKKNAPSVSANLNKLRSANIHNASNLKMRSDPVSKWTTQSPVHSSITQNVFNNIENLGRLHRMMFISDKNI